MRSGDGYILRSKKVPELEEAMKQKRGSRKWFFTNHMKRPDGTFYSDTNWYNMIGKNGNSTSLTKIEMLLTGLGIDRAEWPEYYQRVREDVAEPSKKIDPLLEERKKYREWMRDKFNVFPVTSFLKDKRMSVDMAEEAEVAQRKERARAASEEAVSPLFQERHKDGSLEILSVEKALRRSRHLLIVGEAGDGKSTLMHKLCRKYAGGAELSCPLLLRARECKDLDDVEAYVTSGRHLKSSGIAAGFAGEHWRLICEGKAPLLLDGLDESDRRGEISAALHEFAVGAGRKAIIIVTCRKALAANLLPGFERVEFSPLKREQIAHYVHHRLNAADAKAFMQALDADWGAMALAGSGFLLAMAADLYEKRRFQPPSSRAELYAEATETLLEDPRKDNRPKRPDTEGVFPPDLKREVLEDIAFHWLFCWRDPGGVTEDRVMVSLNRVVNPETRWRKYDTEQAEIRRDLCANSSLLREDEAENGTRFRFYHQSFAEYFAARYMVQHWDADGWRDWLPTQEGWQEWGYPDLPWRRASKEGQETLTQEFACLHCGNRFPPFPDMLLRPEYRETFLLMVGLLNDVQKETIFLNGLAREIPPIPGYESDTYRKGIWFHCWFDVEDKLRGKMWGQETKQQATELPYLEQMTCEDDMQTWLEWGLQAVSRCKFQNRTVVLRALAGLQMVSWRREYGETLQLLGKSRLFVHSSAGVAYYCTLINDPTADEDLRESATEALGNIGSVEAVHTLTTVLNDSTADNLLRLSAARALRDIGSVEATAPLLTFLNDPTADEDLRLCAAVALGTIGSVEAVHTLTTVLNDPTADEDLRKSATEALGNIGSVEATAPLLTFFNDPTADEHLRWHVAYVLGTIGSVEAVHTLTTVLNDSTADNLLRLSAARALRDIGSVEATAPLLTFLNDPTADEDLRLCAAVALCKIGSVEAVHILTTVFNDPTVAKFLRTSAAIALGYTGSVEAVHILTTILNDPTNYDFLRVRATEALGNIGSVEATAPLLAFLNDPTADKLLRTRAAIALGDTGGVTRTELERFDWEAEVNVEVRRHVMRALLEIRDRERTGRGR